jgi:hypothetical protein
LTGTANEGREGDRMNPLSLRYGAAGRIYRMRRQGREESV